MDFQTQWQRYSQRAENALDTLLPQDNSRLHQSMRYAALQGGKRFRAMLVYATGELMNAPHSALDQPAAAIEMIHAYSLIHDDLPAMDDDVLRRGQATTHIAYDEATAILAGDALQTEAFICLSKPNTSLSAQQQSQMVQCLALAAGSLGMAGGQALDMQATGQHISIEQLKTIHTHKTGALIRAAVQLGALASTHTTKADLLALNRYGSALGLAFQVVDDILDDTQSSETLGKTSGADRDMNKNTYTQLLGLTAAREFADELVCDALESLSDFSDNTLFLRELAQFTTSRDH